MRDAYLIGLVVCFILGLIFLFQGYYADSIELITSVLAPLTAGIAVLSATVALKRHWDNPSSRLSRIWLCFTLGMLLWFLGETTWTTYVLALNIEIPYPSVADAFWLTGYVPLFIAIELYVRLFRHALSRKLYFGSTAVLSAGSVAIFSVVAPLIITTEENVLFLGIDLAYSSARHHIAFASDFWSPCFHCD